MALDPAWIALIATVCGGVGLKVTEHWLGRSKVRVDDAARIRDELRLEITAQREEIKQLETDVNRWRDEYYDLRDKYRELQTQLTLAIEKIKEEARAAEIAANVIDSQPPPTDPPLTEEQANGKI